MTARLALALVVTAAGAATLHQLPKRPAVASAPRVDRPTYRDTPPVVSRSVRRASPTPTPTSRSRRRLALVGSHNWQAVAQCESSGNWHTNTGNGFYGGLQFLMSTWRSFGGRGNPAEASEAEQIRIAERILAVQGIRAWPVCGRYL